MPIGKPPHKAAVGDAVNEGDLLITGKDSELHMTMQDAGFIAVRPNTQLQIVSYKADGGSDDKGVFQLVVGGLRSITGWIGRFNQKSYQVRTHDATVGIRGTDHETRYIPVGSSEGAPGTYDKVYAGETVIKTNSGDTQVSADTAGFMSASADQAPRVLPEIPSFFRPGPNEALINTKHAEIQKIIELRREERRKVVEEKRAALDAAQAELKAQAEINKASGVQRKSAADEQRQSSEAQLTVLRDRETALNVRRKSLRDMRQAIQEKIAGAVRRNESLRAQLKTVFEAGKSIASGYSDLKAARVALSEKNLAITEELKSAAEVQQRNTQEQLVALHDKEVALRQKQQDIQELRVAIQEKAASQSLGDRSLAGQRQILSDLVSATEKDRRSYLDEMNALYEKNISASEERIVKSIEQRRSNQQQLAAFALSDEELQQKRRANDELFAHIQESGAKEAGPGVDVGGLLETSRSDAEAIRNERQAIQDARSAIRRNEISGIEERQQAALAQLKEIHQKHRDVREKAVDLQDERASMQEEIKMLFVAEQKRYREELNADRRQNSQLVNTGSASQSLDY